jgi:hypothetical protein
MNIIKAGDRCSPKASDEFGLYRAGEALTVHEGPHTSYGLNGEHMPLVEGSVCWVTIRRTDGSCFAIEESEMRDLFQEAT